MDDIDPAFNPARKHAGDHAPLALAPNRAHRGVKPFQLFRILKP
jgi:hypothetical protein